MTDRTRVEKYIPQNGARFDVIVAGGGPAGIGAALASAQQGARTLLLESRSFFGGIATLMHWMCINRLFIHGANRGGVHDIFVAKIRQYGPDAAVAGREDWVNGDNLDVHPDYLRAAVFAMLEEAGCSYRLYSPVTDVVMDGNSLRGVVTASKEGRVAFYGNVVVDATGDGDVACWAGAPMVKGREEDGLFMPITLGFVLCHADEKRFYAYRADHKDDFRHAMDRARQEGYHLSSWYSFDPTTIPGVISVNNGGAYQVGKLDGSQSRDLTIAERLGMEVVLEFLRFARDKAIPGLENCHLMRTGPGVSVRETRRIVGEYVLTAEDVCSGIEFDDVIARKYGQIDPAGLEPLKDYGAGLRPGAAYPYRCLLPRGVENLLVAGRCGSATHIAHAAGKSMGNMMEIGQAAGVAAALSQKQGIPPRRLNVREVQDRLIAMGVKLFP